MAARPASIKVRALQWLAQREHSRAELKVKLSRLLAASRAAADTNASADTRADTSAKAGTDAGSSASTDAGTGACAQTGADAGAETGAETGAFPGAAGAYRPAADAQVEAEVEQLLDWLTAHGYLCSERFVESRVHARQGRFGNRRIQQELRQHGLTLAPEARQALQASELGRAREVWRKKYGQPAADAAGRARQGRFLVGRGFSADVVRRVVLGLDDDGQG